MDIPDEIWVYILSFLQPQDIQRFLWTCKDFHQLKLYLQDVLTKGQDDYYHPPTARTQFMLQINRELELIPSIDPILFISDPIAKYMGLSIKNWPHLNGKFATTEDIFHKWWFLYVYSYNYVQITESVERIYLDSDLISMFSINNPVTSYIKFEKGIHFNTFTLILHHLLMPVHSVPISIVELTFLYRENLELDTFLMLKYPGGFWRFRRRF